MPLYDFTCACGRVTESRESMDTALIRCKCGKMASRVAVYRDQFIACETGPKGGMKNETPRDEKSYHKEYRRYDEASQDLEYKYSRIDDPKVKKPALWEAAKIKARQRRKAKIGSN